MRKLSILGSTGSIGTSALDVVRRNRNRFDVVALAAGRNLDLLKEQIAEFDPEVVSVMDEEHARRLREMTGPVRADILSGTEGCCRCASLKSADMVLSAMVGAAGLLPPLAAVEAGKAVALANKETLVTAGSLVMSGPGEERRADSVTASTVRLSVPEGQRGGPCGARPVGVGGTVPPPQPERWRRHVRPEAEAPELDHGRKITIDSASMMNKGLEVSRRGGTL
jgi:1-deoxy-D-xylulose-5-phosphate reductoisomerase